MVPPEMVAFEDEKEAEDKEAMEADEALSVVPEAVAKPSHEVEVPFVKERLEMVPFVIVPLVKTPFVAKRLVVVTLVAVAFARVASCREEEPWTVRVDERERAPVDVPPANEMVWFVVLPLVVTD
jgi:hypothetical protein